MRKILTTAGGQSEIHSSRYCAPLRSHDRQNINSTSGLSFAALCTPPYQLQRCFCLPSMLRWRTPGNFAAIMAGTVLVLATPAHGSALILCPILIANMIRRQTNTALVFQMASLQQSFAEIAGQQAAINARSKQHMSLIATNDMKRHIRFLLCGSRHGTATTQGYQRRLRRNANRQKKG